MDNVLCPHCGQAVLGDPQLAERVIACPACQGQFMMPAIAARPAGRVAPPPAPPAPPPVIRTSQPELAPPVIVTAPPQSRQTPKAARRPALDQRALLIVGLAAAALLLVGVGVVVAINWPSGESDTVARSTSGGQQAPGQRSSRRADDLFDRSRPLPPLDQLLGRKFPADHPDAQARIAKAQRRKISIAQGGREVQLGDVHVTNDPVSDYGGFVFGISVDADKPPMLRTASGEEPLRIPRSFRSDQATVRQFLERHHGAANVQFEQWSEEPYYLAHLNTKSRKRTGLHHGRSREEIQRELEGTNEMVDEPFAIGRLERIGTVVRVVYRLQQRGGGVDSDEEFLVLNGQVVNRLTSSRGVKLGRD